MPITGSNVSTLSDDDDEWDFIWSLDLTEAKNEIPFPIVATCVLVSFIPYFSLIYLLFAARKTDDKQPQFVIQKNLILCGVFCIFSLLVFSLIAVASSHSSGLTSTFLLIIVVSVIVSSTLFNYLLFLLAVQRTVLITKTKIGLVVMTGRSLRCEIILIYLLATISSISKFAFPENLPLVDVCILSATIVLFFISTILVCHSDKRLIAVSHVTVISQTVPLLAVQAVFMGIEISMHVFGSETQNINFIQILNALVVSLITPISIILGSRLKRRVVWSILTCKWKEERGRGISYATGNLSADYSNTVSLSPLPESRF